MTIREGKKIRLNMFLVPQVSVNFGISQFLKLYTNLVIHF